MTETTSSKKPVTVIALIMAVCLLGNEMLFIVLPLYWDFFGLTAVWQIGILLSVNRFIRILINPLIALFYQKMSIRAGILVAVLFSVCSTFAYGCLKGIWLLLIARCMWGVAWSLFRLGGYLTVITSSTSKTRGEYVGLFNGLWGIGTLLGMLLGGFLVEQFGVLPVTTGFALLGFLSFPLAYRHLPAAGSVEQHPVHAAEQKPEGQKHKGIALALLTGLSVSFVVYGIFSSTLSKLIEMQLNETIWIASLSIGAATLAGAIQAARTGWEPFLSPWLGKWSDRKWGRSRVLTVSLFAAAACYLLMPLAIPVPFFILIVFVFQLTTTLLVTMSDSNAADLATGESQVKTLSSYTLFSDSGAAFGALLAFIMIDFSGIRTLYWTAGSLLLVLAFLWIVEHRRRREQRAGR
ncbi:MFS transporter [Sporosarcina sp. Te-1]|uniref:MFS transporter n=1 Tax=Sporosarcina sp. Te-1 TaxID=2818390 RepID=UPI001A9D8BE7|nr:MFS transporter [Sporosarcina sp. Te-1]QTD39460.1 MFS transporter [Sporosarcina sp. Te-1]